MLESGAQFSIDKRYRYYLWRNWNGSMYARILSCVLLNPSIADGKRDDNTVRFLTNWAMRNGYGVLRIVNLFAIVGTDPATLKTVDDPVGPDCNQWIRSATNNAHTVLVAWGTHGHLWERDIAVLDMLKEGRAVDCGPDKDYSLRCFGITKGGFPKFPRALRRDVELVPYWEGATP